MCGIAGFWSPPANESDATLRGIAERMANTLTHRGPDDAGTWVDPARGIGLGFRRLSILDLSPLGHQPMHSASGRFTIVYNGEIYNHAELRRELTQLGSTFRGHSDTEVLLAAIEAWGVREAVSRSIGMFAFAVWDALESRLTLVRDRLGIKPLYYGWCGTTLLFGSELKALRAHPAFQAEIDRDAITLLLQHSYIPAPHTIYRGIHKLPAGTTLTISADTQPNSVAPVPYWNLHDVVRTGQAQPFRGTRLDAVDRLEHLLRDAVRLRMIADVPVGAFLSGGIDSSTIVALMQQESTQPVRTFSIGFHEPEFNEAPYARAVAEHLGTEHVERYLTAAETLDVIPRLPTMFDEPFADSSQIPTYLVSLITRDAVTVSLSGDGGDELFGGYSRYQHIQRTWKKVGWLPLPLRRSASAILGRLLPSRGTTLRPLLSAADVRSAYALLHTHWKQPDQIVIGGRVPTTLFDQRDLWNLRPQPIEQMMHLDCLTYLPDDILAKVDRASMAVSLEARIPLLDHRVVEFAWTLPFEYKVHDNIGKQPLRALLSRYVPPRLTDRPKVGFGVPIDRWLRGPLRDWAEDLLAEERLLREGFFNPHPIREKWQRHLAGENWHYWLWDVLMFQAWLQATS